VTRVISHGRITLKHWKLQLKLVKLVNGADTRVLFDPDMPKNTILITEEEDE
jgi:hypothetical protein